MPVSGTASWALQFNAKPAWNAGPNFQPDSGTFTSDGLPLLPIESWSFGAENTSQFVSSSSSGAGAGKAIFNRLIVTRRSDANTAGFFSALCQGVGSPNISVVALNERSPAGSSMRYTFGNVFVARLSTQPSDFPSVTETIELVYGQLLIQATNKDASGLVKVNNGGWSVITNKAITSIPTSST